MLAFGLRSYTTFPFSLFYNPISEEVAIFPMTAKDEIMMKNPDALLNGEAVLQVIKSCVPSVLEPRELTNIDVDALLMGIQSATYGDEMEVSTKCQHCDKELTGSTSIQEALDDIDPLEEVNTIKWDELTVVLRPVRYRSTIEAGLVNFQTTRSLQGIADLPDDMDKLSIFNENSPDTLTLESAVTSNPPFNSKFTPLEDISKTPSAF